MLRFALVLGVGLASVAPAGEFNRVLSVGDPAPAWSDLPGVDDKPRMFDNKSIIVGRMVG